MDANEVVEAVVSDLIWEQEQATRTGAARQEQVQAALQAIRDSAISEPDRIELAARELGAFLLKSGQQSGSIKVRKSEFRLLFLHKNRIDPDKGWRANVEAIRASRLSTGVRLEADLLKAKAALELSRKKYQHALSAWNEWQLSKQVMTGSLLRLRGQNQEEKANQLLQETAREVA